MVTKAGLLQSNPEAYKFLQAEYDEIGARSSWAKPIALGIGLSILYLLAWGLVTNKNICHLDANYVKQVITKPLLYGNLTVVLGGAAYLRRQKVNDWNDFAERELSSSEVRFYQQYAGLVRR